MSLPVRLCGCLGVRPHTAENSLLAPYRTQRSDSFSLMTSKGPAAVCFHDNIVAPSKNSTNRVLLERTVSSAFAVR